MKKKLEKTEHERDVLKESEQLLSDKLVHITAEFQEAQVMMVTEEVGVVM